MADNPIVFACANPDPEIKPELIQEVRSDAIIATGRSDYPNQVNNLIGFPYIFRGALDVRAKEINEDMKVAAANAIALLARENVPDEVVSAYGGDRPRYGKDYIIPTTFDPRLISVIPAAVADAAMKRGVARKNIKDIEIYKDQLTNRLDPTMSLMQGINAKVRKNPKRVIFAEGEDENMLKAAIEFGRNKLGTPILIGAEKRIKEQLNNIGLDKNYKIEIVNSTNKEKREKYVKHLYKRLQREGQLERDVDRLVRNDRIAWGASMIACKDADAMVTGNIRHYAASIDKLKKEKPAFLVEFNEFVQKIKLENNDELVNLHSTISSLREQLENQQFLKNKEIQDAILQTADEIKQLQLTITEQRNQLDKLKFEKKEAIQREIQASSDEINQLKKSCTALRDELENLKFDKQESVQKAILESSQEIKELKLSITDLRNELESLKFEKKEAVQNAVLNSNNEIKQLKSSSQKLREEIEKIIQNYENKLKKD